MSPPSQPNRYDVSGNVEAQYVDDAQMVLVNRLEICDLESLQLKEEAGLAKAYETLIGEMRIDTPLTCDLLKHIHQRIFGELFDWAGRWRTLQISKPNVVWPAAQFLDQSMQDFERKVLAKYSAKKLVSDDDFCLAVGEIQGEFLAIHPFREGNARTVKLFTDMLAAQTGRPFLVYDQTAAGADRYIEAARAALFNAEYRLMSEMAREALQRARSQTATATAGESAAASPPETGATPL
jgi:cell filamentation protein